MQIHRINISGRLIFSLLLKITIAGLLIFFLISQQRLQFSSLKLFWQEPIAIVLLFFWQIVAFVFLGALRLNLLTKFSVNYFRMVKLTLIGNMFNSFLPGAVSGDFVKGYKLYKNHKSLTKATTIWLLLVDRLHGLSALIILSAIGVYFNNINRAIFYFMSLAVFGVCFFYLGLYLIPRLKLLKKIKFTSKIYLFEGELGYARHIQALAVSLIIFTGAVFFLTEVAEKLNIFLNFTAETEAIGLGLISTSLPISPAGIGVGHVAFDYLYDMFGYHGGANLFNIFLVCQLLISLIGLVVFIVNRD